MRGWGRCVWVREEGSRRDEACFASVEGRSLPTPAHGRKKARAFFSPSLLCLPPTHPVVLARQLHAVPRDALRCVVVCEGREVSDHPPQHGHRGEKKNKGRTRPSLRLTWGSTPSASCSGVVSPSSSENWGGMERGEGVCGRGGGHGKGSGVSPRPPALLSSALPSPPARRPASTRARARPTTWASPWCGAEEVKNARKTAKREARCLSTAKKKKKTLSSSTHPRKTRAQVLQQTTGYERERPTNARHPNTPSHLLFLGFRLLAPLPHALGVTIHRGRRRGRPQHRGHDV